MDIKGVITKLKWMLDQDLVEVDINFNKVFCQPETLRSVEEILGEIAALDQELKDLESVIEL